MYLTTQKYNNEIRCKNTQRLDALFEEKCTQKNRGKHNALIISGIEYTYDDLNERANKMARFLIEQGVKSGDILGILLDKSLHTYVTLLAILKTNSAYIPLDITFPSDRIKFISKDANLKYIISQSEFDYVFQENQVAHIYLDQNEEAIARQKSENLTKEEKGEVVDDLCYIIYTSGTTGNPKGVAVEHLSICNFVLVAGEAYGIKESDKVYQGMIIAFDFSIEEIWVPLIAGATLIPAKSAKCMVGEELNDFLISNQVTVMCCVPTLLSTMEKDIPTLRLLLVGGEACPHDMVVKWHNKNRTILNTYGPTETTVTATYTELLPQQPVTIGEPLATYSVVILDENLELVKEGGLGEICIGGIGVTRGYVNRDDLTKEVFIDDFIGLPHNPGKRIYRTGDLGRIDAQGQIEYLGRIDTQVKIRGYRIELTEIESVLLQLDGIAQAAVSTHTSDAGITELVAYCVLEAGVESLPADMTKVLSKKLPGYMVPDYTEILNALPMSASSKVDRKKLPKPTSKKVVQRTKDVVLPKSETEILVANVLAKTLNLEQISANDNIFDDLGGHSLSIALAVSALRKKHYEIGLSDFYKYPTVKDLAQHLEKQTTLECNKIKEEVYKVSNRRYWFMGILQFISAFLYGALFALPAIVMLQYIISHWALYNATELIEMFALFATIVFVVSLILPLAAKWLLLGRIKEGKYKIWSGFAMRLWLVNKAMGLSPHGMFKGTVIVNIYYRLLGAKIGKDVMLNSAAVYSLDMLEVGDKTTVGQATAIYGYEVRNGYIHFGKVKIGSNCFIGANSLIKPHSVMEDGAYLGDQSLLQDTIIPKDEKWAGSPAQKKKTSNPLIDEIDQLTNNDKNIRMTPNLLTTLGMFVFFPVTYAFLGLFITIPLIALLETGYNAMGYTGLIVFAPLGALLFIILLPLGVILTNKIVMSRIKEGVYKVNSFTYIRKLISDSLMALTLGSMNGMYATLYLPPFLRLLGAKIGKHSEISTVASITPSLLDIGDESFLADIATIGPSYLHKGYFGVKSVKIGKRSFVGNAAFVPSGRNIPDETLIGVLSVPSHGKMEEDSTWLGSPSFELPRRQESQYFDESLTFKPTRELYVKRWIYEFFRIALPPVIFAFFGMILILTWYYALLNYSAIEIAFTFPLLLLLTGFSMHLFVVLMKKLFIGTYVPKVKPLWDIFVRRSELVTALYENITVPAFLSAFSGTPFMAPILRMYGIKVGKRCNIMTTYMTEFDLVEIGDDCTISEMTSLQTHLFEDRVMKMSYVRISNGCSVGVRDVILYDSKLEENVVLDSLSLVMKGEILLANGRYRGIPVTQIVQGA